MLRELMRHQSWALDQLSSRPGLFLPPGTGKTLIAIRYIKRNKLLPALIVCRRDDFLTWRLELELDEVSSSNICLIQSSRDMFPAWFRLWTLITYDLVRKIAHPVALADFRSIVADESYMIKHWSAKRTKALIKATRHVPYRIAMTGTPITNDLGDVFTQCLFMDRGELFGTSYWAFRNKYYIQSGPGWYLKRTAKRDILEKLKSIAICVDEDDVLKLPPVRRVLKSVPISGAQKRLQNSILQNWEYQLRQGTDPIEVNHVVTQLTKLRQVASGFIYDEKGGVHWMKSYKLQLLKDMLTDDDLLGTKPKLVIWCAFTAEIKKIKQLAEELSIEAVTFYGRQNKDKARKDFQNDKSIRLFVGQSDSGVGMNELVVSDTAVYYSNSYRVVSRQQSEGRIRRKGSERHQVITYWDLVTEGTVDESMLKSLQRNISLANFITEGLRNYQPLSQILGVNYGTTS